MDLVCADCLRGRCDCTDHHPSVPHAAVTMISGTALCAPCAAPKDGLVPA